MLRSIFILLLAVFSLSAQDIIYDVRAIVVPADTSKPFYELEVFAEGHPQSRLKNPGNFGVVGGHPILLVPTGALVKFEGQVRADGRPGLFKVRSRYSKEWLENNTLVIDPEVEFVQLQLCGLDKTGKIRASFLLEVVVRPEVKPVVKVVDESKYKKYLLYKKKELQQKTADITAREKELLELQQNIDKYGSWIGMGIGFDLARNNNLFWLYSSRNGGVQSDVNLNILNYQGSYFGYQALANFWLQPFGLDLDLTVGQMESSNRERSYFSASVMQGWQLSNWAAWFVGVSMNKYFRSNIDQGMLPQPAGYNITVGVSQRKDKNNFLSILVNVTGDVWRGVTGKFGSIYISSLPPTLLYNYSVLLENGFSLSSLFASKDNYFVAGLKVDRGDMNYLRERLFVEGNHYPEFQRRVFGFILWNTETFAWYLAGEYRARIGTSNGPLFTEGGLFLPVKQVKIGLTGRSDLQGGNQIGLNVIWKLL